MASLKDITVLSFFILVLCSAKRTASTSRNWSFVQITSSVYGAAQLGDPWRSPSVFASIIACTDLYNTACTNLTYDQSGFCTPGSDIQVGGSPIGSGPGVQFFYAVYNKICDTDKGQEAFTMGSAAICLFVSRVSTRAKNSTLFLPSVVLINYAGRQMRLYTAETQDKFDMYCHIASQLIGNQTWLGLTDQVVEGTWIRESGHTISPSRMAEIFLPGQPNNAFGNQNCAYIREDYQRVSDKGCASDLYFICEPLE